MKGLTLPLPLALFLRVSVVGVAAEVHVCRRMADDTGGTYAVALGGSHLEELMLTHAPPPPASAASAGAQLVREGVGEAVYGSHTHRHRQRQRPVPGRSW